MATEGAGHAGSCVTASKRLRGMGLAVDLVVMRRSGVDEWLDVPGSLVRAALSEGRVVT